MRSSPLCFTQPAPEMLDSARRYGLATLILGGILRQTAWNNGDSDSEFGLGIPIRMIEMMHAKGQMID
jgi:hypothetical protein